MTSIGANGRSANPSFTSEPAPELSAVETRHSREWPRERDQFLRATIRSLPDANIATIGDLASHDIPTPGSNTTYRLGQPRIVGTALDLDPEIGDPESCVAPRRVQSDDERRNPSGRVSAWRSTMPRRRHVRHGVRLLDNGLLPEDGGVPAGVRRPDISDGEDNTDRRRR
jgi:hypothetical protein